MASYSIITYDETGHHVCKAESHVSHVLINNLTLAEPAPLSLMPRVYLTRADATEEDWEFLQLVALSGQPACMTEL